MKNIAEHIEDVSLMDPNSLGIAIEYAGWAPTYRKDVTERFIYNAATMVAKAVERHVTVPAPRIFDAGTGDGLVLENLRRSFSDACCVGADLSKSMLEKCRQNRVADELHLCNLDQGVWPTQDESFDAVTSAGVMSMIQSTEHFFEQAARSLKPGGILATSFLISEQSSKMFGLPTTPRFKTYFRSAADMIEAGQVVGMELAEPITEYVGFKGPGCQENHGLSVFRKTLG